MKLVLRIKMHHTVLIILRSSLTVIVSKVSLNLLISIKASTTQNRHYEKGFY